MITVGPPTELCELAQRYGTDKWFYYTGLYHELLHHRRHSVRKVLELGIGYPSLMLDSLSRMGITTYTIGASLFMWRDYFPNATIYGLDNNRDTLISADRIEALYCDVTNPDSYPLSVLGSKFDLIVDDASHQRDHQMTALTTLMPQLDPDGLYIIEDVGYLSRACRLEFAKSIPYPATLHEFHNPKLGSHIAACIVVTP